MICPAAPDAKFGVVPGGELWELQEKQGSGADGRIRVRLRAVSILETVLA